jgi:DNA repair exonuclease SbcCD ATPase subunit
MATANGAYASSAQFIDWLFAQLPGMPGQGPAMTATGPLFDSSGFPGERPDMGGPPAMVWPQAPPSIESSADVQAAHEWLQAERRRLDSYTRSQFEMIRQQHQTLLTKHFRSEETLALRAQELNREMQFLAAQSEAFQKRAQELAEREKALASQVEKLARAHEDVLDMQQNRERASQDTEAQRAYLASLKAETTDLQAAGEAARTEFASFEAALKERQQLWEKKQAEITARQAEMEQRYKALEKAEDSAARRLRELEELEDQLRDELEKQELQLVRERREIEELRARLREATRPRPPALHEVAESESQKPASWFDNEAIAS